MVPDGFNKRCMIASKKCFCIHTYSNSSSHCVSYKTIQKVCFLILRILIVASFSLRHWSHLPTLELLCVVFIGTCCLYAIMRPYRLNSGNNVDILVLASLAILSLTFPIALHQDVYSQTVVYIKIITTVWYSPHGTDTLSSHKFAKKHCLKKYGDL